MNKDKSIKDLKQYNDKLKNQLEYSKIRVWSLERENDRLTNELNTCMIERNNFLSRIEKAVAYIKSNEIDVCTIKNNDIYDTKKELLNILNGSDK